MKRDEPDMQPAYSMAAMEQACTIDHCSDEEEAEGDRPVSSKEYDDLCCRHHKLQEDYINLEQDCFKLRSENDDLKHELQKSKFSYSNVKSSIGQLLFFTGLTSVIFEWVLKKMMCKY